MSGFEQIPALTSEENLEDKSNRSMGTRARLLASVLAASSPMAHDQAFAENLEQPPVISGEQLEKDTNQPRIKLEEASVDNKHSLGEDQKDENLEAFLFSSKTRQEEAQRESEEKEWLQEKNVKASKEYHQEHIDRAFRDRAEVNEPNFPEAPPTKDSVERAVDAAIDDVERRLHAPEVSELEAARNLLGNTLDQIRGQLEFDFPDSDISIEDNVRSTGDVVVGMTLKQLEDAGKLAVRSHVYREILENFRASGRISGLNEFDFDSRNPANMAVSDQWNPLPGVRIRIGADMRGYDLKFDPHAGVSLEIRPDRFKPRQ